MDQFILTLATLFNTLQEQALPALSVVGMLWLIHIINVLMHKRLNRLGIYPRRLSGLPGIVFSPMLHGGFDHLFFNSIPLFVLLDFILLKGTAQTIQVTMIITMLCGSLTWLFGRPGIHVGASSVIMGYLGYLLIDAYQNPSINTWILGAICLYYFGSFLFSIFPAEEKTSWEGHLFGLIAGVATVFLLPLISI